MKKIKILIFLIILAFVGVFVYQNLVYFNARSILSLDLKIPQWHWSLPELPNYVFWLFCLVLGLLIAGIRGFMTSFGLARQIRQKDMELQSQTIRISELESRLDVFLHDPYIKKEITAPAPEAEATTPGDTGTAPVKKE